MSPVGANDHEISLGFCSFGSLKRCHVDPARACRDRTTPPKLADHCFCVPALRPGRFLATESPKNAAAPATAAKGARWCWCCVLRAAPKQASRPRMKVVILAGGLGTRLAE